MTAANVTIVELALFRILQESLTNVHRHSGSPTVEVKIEVDAEIVSLAISDAGRGIQEQAWLKDLQSRSHFVTR